GAKSGIFAGEPPPELVAVVLEVTDELHREYARVADIYFEKLNADEPVGPRGLSEYYRTQVLIHFPKQHLNDLWTGLAARLSRSPHAALQAMGKSLQTTYGSGITH